MRREFQSFGLSAVCMYDLQDDIKNVFETGDFNVRTTFNSVAGTTVNGQALPPIQFTKDMALPTGNIPTGPRPGS